MQKAVALPVGILAAICILMFIFIWWWFPRHWKKGVKADQDEWDEARRQRDAREIELEAQRQAGQGDGSAPPAYTEAKPPPPKLTYVPPVTAY